MTPAELDRLAKLAGIPIPKETPMPDTVPQIADGAADGALPPCWPKTGYVTRERYCGKHGRAAGWPCRGGGPVSGESRPVWPGGGEYQAYGLGAARAAETVSETPETAPSATDPSDPVSSRTDALRAPDGPAGRLRRAADLLEQLAAEATDGPWYPEHAYDDRSHVQAVFVECPTGGECCEYVDCVEGTHGIGGFDADPDNRLVILLRGVPGPLAAWLRAEAQAADMAARVLALTSTREALAVADLILGADQ